MASAGELRKKARVATHSLDPEEVRKASQGAFEAMASVQGSLEERLRSLDRRKHLAAAIGTVSVLFSALLAAALTRLRTG